MCEGLSATKLCGERLCVTKLCGERLCVEKTMCLTKSFVTGA